jgi:anti-anti-sigma factor
MCVTEISVGREVVVSGRLDVDTVADVRVALYEILDRGSGDLLIHLAQAEVHDATGLGVIVGIHHRARRLGRRLVLVDVSPRLDRLLHASRLHRVLVREPGNGLVTLPPSAETAPAPKPAASSVRSLPPSTMAASFVQTVPPSTESVAPLTE